MNVLPRLLRLFYPLKSGMGTIANCNVLRRLDGNTGGDIVASSGRFDLVVPQDDYVGRSVKYFGDLDPKVTWVVQKVLQPGDIALDIGANLGLVSFKMLERVGGSGKVIAFEPQSRMTAYLTQSIARNDVDNLHVHKTGLGDRTATLRLSIPETNAGSASFVARDTARSSRVEEVPVTTLDDFHERHGLDGVRLIKIDVEGFEPQVFAGGRNFFSTVKPDVVVFEENRKGDGVPETVSIVQSYGYDVFSLPKVWFSVALRPYRPGAEAHDFVAIHRSAPSDVRRRLGL